MKEFRVEIENPEDLNATDLAERVSLGYDDCVGAGRVVLLSDGCDTGAERLQWLLVDNGGSLRIGIAWGGNADWGDVNGAGDEAIHAAIHDYLNDADAWDARN